MTMKFSLSLQQKLFVFLLELLVAELRHEVDVEDLAESLRRLRLHHLGSEAGEIEQTERRTKTRWRAIGASPGRSEPSSPSLVGGRPPVASAPLTVSTARTHLSPSPAPLEIGFPCQLK